MLLFKKIKFSFSVEMYGWLWLLILGGLGYWGYSVWFL